MVMALDTVFSMERLQGQGKDSSPSSGPRMLTGLFSCTSRAGDFGTLTTVSDHCPSFFRDDKTEINAYFPCGLWDCEDGQEEHFKSYKKLKNRQVGVRNR